MREWTQCFTDETGAEITVKVTLNESSLPISLLTMRARENKGKTANALGGALTVRIISDTAAKQENDR